MRVMLTLVAVTLVLGGCGGGCSQGVGGQGNGPAPQPRRAALIRAAADGELQHPNIKYTFAGEGSPIFLSAGVANPSGSATTGSDVPEAEGAAVRTMNVEDKGWIRVQFKTNEATDLTEIGVPKGQGVVHWIAHPPGLVEFNSEVPQAMELDEVGKITFTAKHPGRVVIVAYSAYGEIEPVVFKIRGVAVPAPVDSTDQQPAP